MLQELGVYKENDPELIEKMKTDTRVALDAANRWTGTPSNLTHDIVERAQLLFTSVELSSLTYYMHPTSLPLIHFLCCLIL